jgi:hypothetical protein
MGPYTFICVFCKFNEECPPLKQYDDKFYYVKILCCND